MGCCKICLSCILLFSITLIFLIAAILFWPEPEKTPVEVLQSSIRFFKDEKKLEKEIQDTESQMDPLEFYFVEEVFVSHHQLKELNKKLMSEKKLEMVPVALYTKVNLTELLEPSEMFSDTLSSFRVRNLLTAHEISAFTTEFNNIIYGLGKIMAENQVKLLNVTAAEESPSKNFTKTEIKEVDKCLQVILDHLKKIEDLNKNMEKMKEKEAHIELETSEAGRKFKNLQAEEEATRKGLKKYLKESEKIFENFTKLLVKSHQNILKVGEKYEKRATELEKRFDEELKIIEKEKELFLSTVEKIEAAKIKAKAEKKKEL